MPETSHPAMEGVARPEEQRTDRRVPRELPSKVADQKPQGYAPVLGEATEQSGNCPVQSSTIPEESELPYIKWRAGGTEGSGLTGEQTTSLEGSNSTNQRFS